MNGILVVLDYALVRQALKKQIESDGSLQVIGEAEDCPSACWMAREMIPEAIVIDLENRRMNGIETAFELRKRFPQIPQIILCANDNLFLRARLQKLGEPKRVLKRPDTAALLEAIHQAIRSGSALPN